MRPDQIPQQLKEKPQWVCWRYEQRNDKTTKVPIDARTGKRASTTDSGTWSLFETAVSAATHFDGVGFVFNGDYTGVDLDRAIHEDKPKPWAAKIIDSCATYAEFSPSGTGVHLISEGALPEGWSGRKRAFRDGAIEIYSRARFFTVTGNRLETA